MIQGVTGLGSQVGLGLQVAGETKVVKAGSMLGLTLSQQRP